MQKPEFIVDREKLQTRMEYMYDSPPETVWKVFTDPKLIPQWWGPRNLETTVEEMDFKVGGKWRFIHTDKAGGKYVFYGEYKEIEPPHKTVQTFEYEPFAGHVILETMTLEEVGGKTKLTQISQFASIEDLDGMVQSGMETGAVETLERVAEVLAGMK